MADVRPFAALRYRTEAAGDLSAVLAPPFDVISPEEHRTLLQSSPYNIVRLELPRSADTAADPYQAAGETLRAWRAQGVLARDAEPALYLHEQEFDHEGRRLRRHVIFARLRLEPWEAGVIRPHEHTGPADKEDRLRLLRATRTNISPVFLLYRDPQGAVASLAAGGAARPLAEATSPDGQHHRLATLTDRDACAALSETFQRLTLYVADGHHRYETALAYRDECRLSAAAWAGEEPENFVLAGLTAAEDSGLLVLPIHRLLSLRPAPGSIDRLRQVFEARGGGLLDMGAPLEAVLAATATASRKGAAFAAAGLEPGRFTLLTLRDQTKVDALMPARPAAAWREVDAAILRYVVLEWGLGLPAAALDDAAALTYSEDAEFAVREMLAGRRRLAFLLNPTPIDRILAVADGGERMPRKSTFFHPKLPTGLVLNPLDL